MNIARGNKAQENRDREIARLRGELNTLEWRIKRDEAIPADMRRALADKELTDSLVQELAAHCPRDCERFMRVRRQLRRLFR